MSWKSRVRRTINSGLEPAGFTLRRFQPEMQVRVMNTVSVRQRQISSFRKVMAQSLREHPHLAENIPNESQIESFVNTLLTCPVRQETGGGGFSAAMLLWAIGKSLHPSVVVESGVFRGFTTWVLLQACPQARQYAFDISFKERQRVESEVNYHETDWMNVPIRVGMDKSALIYFDDHVDQWRRIREAAERGFRYLVFDDSLPSHALHNDGQAAVPTVDMLFETDLADGEEISWQTECGPFSYRYNAQSAEETRELVEGYVRLPDLHFVFGYAPANIVIVVLR